MKIRTDIENLAGRYNVQVGTFDFSANEAEQILKFGDPLVDVGGSFNGSLSRPGQVDTILTVNGSHTVLAVMAPVILAGAITGVTVTAAGRGYTAATISVTGDGTSAALTALFGAFGGTVVAPGSLYLLNDIVTIGSPNPIVIKVTGVNGGGGVTSFSIISNGMLTAVDSTVGIPTVGGAGTGFTVDLSGQWGVTGATVSSGGSGYNVVPTAVTFTLPSQLLRMQNDFPVKQVFDLADSPDSDVMARVWADTIAARLTASKSSLMAQVSPFEGETVVTV